MARVADIRIADMKVGDTGWTVPWALCRDEKGRLSLNSEYPLNMFASRAGYTVQMKVKRTRKGWVVDVTRCPLQALGEIWASEHSYFGRFEFARVRRVVWFNPLTLCAEEGAW